MRPVETYAEKLALIVAERIRGWAECQVWCDGIQSQIVDEDGKIPLT
jgi:hypothetical protein